jgi:predicted TIM-barrel fold metal-dependent hydrolase
VRRIRGLRRDYLIGDFRRDIDGVAVVASVHIQAEHDPRDPVRETRWLQSIADDRDKSAGLPHGIVAYADLSAPDVEPTLQARRGFATTRGIRQSLNGILNDPGANKDLLRDPIWRSNLALVGRLGFSFDLQLYPQQVALALPLLRANPDMQLFSATQACPRTGRRRVQQGGDRPCGNSRRAKILRSRYPGLECSTEPGRAKASGHS